MIHDIVTWMKEYISGNDLFIHTMKECGKMTAGMFGVSALVFLALGVAISSNHTITVTHNDIIVLTLPVTWWTIPIYSVVFAAIIFVFTFAIGMTVMVVADASSWAYYKITH